MSDENEIIEESEETDEPTGPVVIPSDGLDYLHDRMLTLYANGLPVAEIAEKMGYQNPGTIYQKLNEFPIQYANAKRKLAETRNAKYRRIGAVASDILIDSLEKMKALLAGEEEIKARMMELKGDDPELEILKLQLKEIAEIRGDLKTISTVAENAEKRADFNEGLATDRHEIGGLNGQPLPAFNIIIKKNDE